MDEIFTIITFASTHNSISAVKALEAKDIPHKLIALPTDISAGCGFCLRINMEEIDTVYEALKERGIYVSGEYIAERKGLKTVYREQKPAKM